MLARMGRKMISFALLVGMQAGAATLENSMEVPQKTKNTTTLWPSNCTTQYLSKGYRYAVLKGHMHPDVYSSTINNSQSMERAQMSINGWIDKEDVVCVCTYIYTYTHTDTMEYYLEIKKNEILTICSHVDGAREYYAKWNKSEKDKYHIISLTCGI